MRAMGASTSSAMALTPFWTKCWWWRRVKSMTDLTITNWHGAWPKWSYYFDNDDDDSTSRRAPCVELIFGTHAPLPLGD
uniref:Putative secreted peptide n=1 Tax=Anopheles braziliensis TaxID=58242 RepID=A0A2M3ZXT9_9DIPT